MEISFLARLFLAVLATHAHGQSLSPINTNDPVAIVEGLKDSLEGKQAQLDHLSFVLGERDKSLVNLLKKDMLTMASGGKENASECAISLVQFIYDLVERKPYALKMADSWGKLESGIATGNLDWLGRYYECLEVQARTFSGKFCGAVIGSTDAAPFGIGAQTSITVGTCLPDTCSIEQIAGVMSLAEKIVKKPVRPFCPEQPVKYNGTDIAALILCACLGIVVILSTSYELYLMFQPSVGYDHLLIVDRELASLQNDAPTAKSELLLSFSLIKNTKALLDTSQKEGNINVLHGLRFISMTWVILGHTFIFCTVFIDNPMDFANYYLSNWSFQAVGNATFSVDTFFFLSGLLAAYLGMREMKKRGGKLSVGMPYLYRYLRLTPAYAFCMFFAVSLYSKLGDGPLWPNTFEAFRTPCQKYWWTNLLYINNLYPITMGEECFGWGWYLANDTQFFLLSPFILWALYKWPGIGISVLGVGTLASISATSSISSHYQQQPQALGIGLTCDYIVNLMSKNGTAGLYGHSISNVTTPHPTTPAPPSKVDTFFSDIYQKPWCRMGVYFIGIATGYVLYSTKLKVRMNKTLALLAWILAFAAGLSILYGQYGHISDAIPMKIGVAAFYNGVTRPAWAICLAWIVIACSSGYGGPINGFLSWKAFIPLSRLTYCAYLVHPLVIYWAYSTQEIQMHFSISKISIHFLGFVAMSYAIAYVVSMLVEMPMMGIIRTLMGKNSSSKLHEERLRSIADIQGSSEA